MVKNSKTKPIQTHRRKRYLLGIVVFIILYSIACFTPYISGYPLFPIYVIRCGKLPIPASTFATSFIYLLPGDRYYGPGKGVDKYFCTEQEALEAGFHRLEPY